MALREFRTAVLPEEMNKLFKDGIILALMSNTRSLKRFRKSSHLEIEVFRLRQSGGGERV